MTHNFHFGALACAVIVQYGLILDSALAHSDIFVTAVGSQVAVGGANVLGTIDENFDLTTRVFEGVMMATFPPFDPADYGRDEPGVDALPSSSAAFPAGASALPGNAAVTINLLPFTVGSNTDTLFYWDGSGAVDFQPISIAQPGVGMALDSNPIGTTSASGALHEHPAFMLDIGGAAVPADGVYLISPTVSVAGLLDSEKFFMVWLVDALLVDEDAAEGLEEALEEGETVYLDKDFAFFEQAVEYVQNQLVPEPTSGFMGLLALVGVTAAMRRRTEMEAR